MKAMKSDIERMLRQQDCIKAPYQQIMAKRAHMTAVNFVLNNPMSS